MSEIQKYTYCVVGGGFFGTYLAHILYLKNPSSKIALFEQSGRLLSRASFNNQARIHMGYHYPRSFLTGYSSCRYFDRFVDEFQECVHSEYEMYYAVGRVFSKVSPKQFSRYCSRIGAPLYPAEDDVKSFFNKELIGEVFKVREYVFDADVLRELLQAKVYGKADIFLKHRVIRVSEEGDGSYRVLVSTEDGSEIEVKASYVFICTYSNINPLLTSSGLEMLNLKEQMTEMALIKVPKELRNKGVTVMCGPFFSCMPFPPRKLHTLSHVRYTPHFQWFDRVKKIDNGSYYSRVVDSLPSNYPKMERDSSRYLPLLAGSEYVDSIWEVKTILPRSQNDDGRPILFRNMGGRLYCILGGKLDNIYDLQNYINKL